MKQEYYFKHAKWVGAAERTFNSFSILRGHFYVDSTMKRVSLNILGLGFLKCYINGICINPDTFLPLSSDYEASCDPVNEIFSDHRIYVPQFDITPFVKKGDNVIAIHYGGGWYPCRLRTYGLPKAIYCISVEEENGIRDFISDENCRIGKSYVEDDYYFLNTETHNYINWDSCLDADFDDSKWENAVCTEQLDTEYCTTDCPVDALIEILAPAEIGKGKNGMVYDCGRNTTGYPVLELCAESEEVVYVYFSEELLFDGTIDLKHHHSQIFTIKSDGQKRIVQPEFIWFGFRCFEVVGNAKVKCVKVVHADIDPSSTFDCDNETLNWMHKTFLNTMLTNMHTGHPSDCPHLERRGYTGDGQLTCHAALTTLDARAFYEKWLQDIADSQDVLSGHIQYIAPYSHGGGGPGGWGCAIVEVPWQLYRHFGDKQILVKYYKNMQRYIDYLDAHSEFNLVTSDKEGEWCLGDWCVPNILYPDKDITKFGQQIFLPTPMVNTYFMVKSLNRMCKIARIIGKEEDICEYEKKAEVRKCAIRAAYFNTLDNNFIMNVQGANSYGVDLGLGTSKTYQNMVDYYKKLGCLDTGIFATDILIRVLFENGDGELAVDLLTSKGAWGFERWRQNGATTFYECWPCNRSRSHNHPMFGAPVAYLFEYLLGIQQKENTAGYESLLIAPQAVTRFNRMSGSMKIPKGTVSVSYIKDSEGIQFHIHIPQNTQALFRYKDQERVLLEGENVFYV